MTLVISACNLQNQYGTKSNFGVWYSQTNVENANKLCRKTNFSFVYDFLSHISYNMDSKSYGFYDKKRVNF